MFLRLIDTFDWGAIQNNNFSTNRSEKLNGTNSMSPYGCLYNFNFDGHSDGRLYLGRGA